MSVIVDLLRWFDSNLFGNFCHFDLCNLFQTWSLSERSCYREPFVANKLIINQTACVNWLWLTSKLVYAHQSAAGNGSTKVTRPISSYLIEFDHRFDLSKRPSSRQCVLTWYWSLTILLVQFCVHLRVSRMSFAFWTGCEKFSLCFNWFLGMAT